MKKWLLLATVMVLALLQLSWPEFLVFFHTRPDLLLIFVIAAVFYLDLKSALVFGVLCGLLKDVFLPQSFGINTVLFIGWAGAIRLLGRQISTEHDLIRYTIVLIVAFLNNIIIGLQTINIGNYIPAGIFLRNLIVGALYTAALSPFVFKLAKKITA